MTWLKSNKNDGGFHGKIVRRTRFIFIYTQNKNYRNLNIEVSDDIDVTDEND